MDSIEPNDWVEYYSESRQINCWSSKSRSVSYPAATRNQVELFQVGWVMFPDESFYNVFTGATTSDITLLDQYVHPAVNDSSNSSDPSVQIGRSDNKVTGEVVVLENKSSPAWKCKWCQADNNGKHLACKLCGQPKGVQAQNNQPKQCAHCTFDNPSTAVKCEACERPLSVSASDGWKCGNCTLVNKDELTNCGVCDTIRSGGDAGSGGGGGNGFGGGGNSNNTNYESKMATDNKSSSNTPLDKAVALLMAGSNDNKVRTMLKKECGLSMGKAQKVLREAKKKRKEGSNNISESKVQTLRVPSNSVNCGICDERIRRGDRGTGKAATSATNLCEHYFCFACLG